jgi:hypothetical protein
MTRQHHRTARAIAFALALTGSFAPVALADPEPLLKAEAAIAANHSSASPAVLPSTASTPPAVVRVTTPSGGFDWGDAGIGAGGMLALTLIGLGGTLTATHRRNHLIRDQHAR